MKLRSDAEKCPIQLNVFTVLEIQFKKHTFKTSQQKHDSLSPNPHASKILKSIPYFVDVRRPHCDICHVIQQQWADLG